jgi:malate dehydrogenase (oxaloacetate-decarboxylating)(NADP+)
MSISTLPSQFFTTDHHLRCLKQLRVKTDGLERYIYMSSLKERDPSLFYELLLENMMVSDLIQCAHTEASQRVS